MSVKQNVRLSKYVSPQRYALTIRPDLEAFTFVGEEIIDINLTKSEKSLTLHSKDIEVLSGYWQVNKSKIDASKITYDVKSETVTIHFPKTIHKGKGKLQLHFRGIISESLRGFYRSQYTHKGKVKKIATTQFEATDARRAFPCFDEPAHKAVFDLTLVVPNHMTAISNTIETATPDGVEHDPGYKVVRFEPTPKMSTYLLAYIIGDFEKSEIKTKHGVTIRVFTTPGKKKQVKFALDVAKRSLEFMNDYFSIPYPLPVLDLITIPDFSSAAMENWGAVTFRESALLVDEENTAFANKQHVAEVIAHELVHQWFGNLVTMEWWTHLWLNESFAPFMANMTMDHMFPEWKIWTRFVMHDHTNALQLDSLENTHPIEVEVHHPSQISEIFDAISYDKGASVLRMLKTYIGDDNFRDGLRYYLKKHSYKNTSSIHLWEAFEKVSKKPISKFMKQWVSKPGYPLISVVETKPGQLVVSQSRFGLKKTSDKTLWPVPLQFELDKGKFSDLEVLDNKQKQLKVSLKGKYVKTNPDETGFYRTLYSPSLLAKLYEPIKKQELSVTDRYGIIRDLFAMVKSGRLPTTVYLEFLDAYKLEESYIVWMEILSGMKEIHELVSDIPKLRESLSKHYRGVLRNVVKTVGWTIDHKESQSRSLLRGAVLYAYGSYGDKATIAQAEKLFANRKKKPIHPDIRAAVYTLYGMNAVGKKQIELHSLYEKETLQEEQRRLGRAIMSIKNPNLFEQNLNYSLSKKVRSQDAPIMIAVAAMLNDNQLAIWKWIQKNWLTIQKKYENDHLLVWFVKSLDGFSNAKYADQITKFFKKYPAPAAERAIKQVVEKINLKDAWLKRDRKIIEKFLKNIA